jgi:hypothetical protein
MAQISNTNPKRTMMGARVILRKLKISSLNSSGVGDFPPIISRNPKMIMIKPMVR